MSSRYWVHGTGDWSDYTNHWAETSNGAEGASLPTSSDDVFIDENSGFGSGGTISLDWDAEFNDFTCSSGHTYNIGDGADGDFKVSGSLVLESGLTLNPGDKIRLVGTTSETLTINNATILSGLNVEAVEATGSWTLQDNLVITGSFYQENGTFDANDHNVTANDFYFYADTGYTPTVIMGSGTWEATLTTNGYGWFIDEYNLEVVSFTPETSTIKISGINNEDIGLYSIGKTYNNIWFTGTGSANYWIDGNNTFNDFKIDQGLSVQLSDGGTTTITTFTAIGSSGNLITLNTTNISGSISTSQLNALNIGTNYTVDLVCNLDGTDAYITITSVDGSGGITGYTITNAGTNVGVQNYHVMGGDENAELEVLTIDNIRQHTLSKSSGIVSCDYLDISNSNATGGATWYAGSHSADTTNNDGWLFEDDQRINGPFPIFYRP